MVREDRFTDTPESAAAYEQTHGDHWEYEPPFPLGSGNVPPAGDRPR